MLSLFLTFLLALLVAIVAALLFTLWNTRRVERAYPPLGQLISVEGRQVHVLDKGEGTPVVMLHGASANLREWTSTIFDDVAVRHRAIAIDRPGHGWTERGGPDAHDPREQAKFLADTLHEMGVERPVLVAHSWAGALALAYALREPENLGGILFLAGVSHPWPGGVEWYRDLSAHPIWGRIFTNVLLAPIFRLALKGGTHSVFHPDTPPEGYAEKAGVPLYSRPGNFRATAADIALLKPIVEEMQARYHEIHAPLIALTGDEDNVVWTELHNPPLVDKVANGRLEILPGVGHMPHHIAPKEVLAAIDELVELRNAHAERAGAA